MLCLHEVTTTPIDDNQTPSEKPMLRILFFGGGGVDTVMKLS